MSVPLRGLILVICCGVTLLSQMWVPEATSAQAADTAIRSQAPSVDVRIAARWRADGSVEFAVQEQTLAGWSERILPRLRIYRPASEPSSWANSTPVKVQAMRPAFPWRNPEARLASSGFVDDSTTWGTYRSPSGTKESIVQSTVQHRLGVEGEISLQYACYGEHLWLAIGGLPEIDRTAARVQWSVDGVAQSQQTWNAVYRGTDIGWVVSPPDDISAITAIRGSTTVSVSVASTPPVRATFDVSTLFASPLQRDLNECTRPFDSPSATVEIGVSARTVADGWVEFALRQQDEDGNWLDRVLPTTRHMFLQSRSTSTSRWLVSSEVTIFAAPSRLQPVRDLAGWSPEGVLYSSDGLTSHVFSPGYFDDSTQSEAWLWVGCGQGALVAAVGGWPFIGSTRVEASWRVDHGPLRRWHWSTVALGGEQAIGSMAHAEMIASPIGGEWLSVTLEGPKPVTARLPLEGLFSTPVQANLEQCGEYGINQTIGRDEALQPPYTPIRDVTGESGGVRYIATNDLYEGRLTTRVQVVSDATPGFTNHVVLRIECGKGRLWLSVWGWAGGDQLQPVRWSIDDGTDHRETWDQWFGNTNTGYWISPRLDWQVIKVLQSGDRLRLSTGGDAPTYFNLAGLFQTPVQPNLEHCGLWHEDAMR